MSAPPQNPPVANRPHDTTGPREQAIRKEPGRLRRLLKLLGPGLIAGASDDDPATVGTCATVGAQTGYAMLWLMIFAIPLMIAVQFISAKIGQVTGRGFAAVLKKHYPAWLLYGVVLSLTIANTINAGADLSAMAASCNLIFPQVPAGYWVVPIALVILNFQCWGSYRLIERIFTWLVLTLLAYIGAGVLSGADWGAVLYHTLVPTFQFDPAFLTAVVALLGTTFAPYLFFWQSDQEVEEKMALGRRSLWQRQGTTDTELHYTAWDIGMGMTVSNVVAYFIILATASALYGAQGEVATPADAAAALAPVAGPAAKYLLAVGLIGAGFLAVPVLTTSAAYTLAEAFGWKYSLDLTPGRAKRFYAVITATTAIAVAINYLGINPMDALFLTSAIYGFLAPPLLILLLVVTNNRGIMGDKTNGPLLNALGGIAALACSVAAIGLVATWILGTS